MPGGFFASETHAGAHPAVVEAVVEANHGLAAPYGEDELTVAVGRRLEAIFGPFTDYFLVLTGTAANLAALGAVMAPHEAVVCADCAHLHEDECGAFERLLGRKLLTVPARDGKLDPDAVRTVLGRGGLTRAVQPRVLSLTQSTELGTTYDPRELTALCEFAHDRGLLVHVDGARLANAAAFLGTGLAGASRACGVDLLSLGLSKVGGLAADVVLLFTAAVAQEPRFLQKQLLQSVAKSRFLAAQVLALLEDDLWLANAAHSNAMARRLANGLADVPSIEITRPVEANSVFAILTSATRERLRERIHLDLWDAARGEVRMTCAWNTELGAVDDLAAAIRAECG
jgi:threonine aldolase